MTWRFCVVPFRLPITSCSNPPSVNFDRQSMPGRSTISQTIRSPCRWIESFKRLAWIRIKRLKSLWTKWSTCFSDFVIIMIKTDPTRQKRYIFKILTKRLLIIQYSTNAVRLWSMTFPMQFANSSLKAKNKSKDIITEYISLQSKKRAN